jgi:hypothetical protein
VLNVLVTEIVLQGSRVMAIVGELEPTGVSQHGNFRYCLAKQTTVQRISDELGGRKALPPRGQQAKA